MLADTMRVAHTFEVVKQAKVVAVICKEDIDPVCRCLVYCRLDPEPQTYMYLRGGVGVLLLPLVSTAALRLGSWGGACRWQRCCQYLAAGNCGWRLGTVWRCEPPWEGNQFRTNISHCNIPLQALEFFTSPAAISPTPARRYH